MEDLEDRIRKLGKILNSREYAQSSGGCASYQVYTYPRKERKKASSELKSLRTECIDENIIKLIDDRLYERRKETRETKQAFLKGLLGSVLVLGISLAIGYGIRGCNREEENQEVRTNEEINMPSPFDIREYTRLKKQALERLEVDKKILLDEEYNQKKAKEYDKIIQGYAKEIRTRIGKGDLTPKDPFYEEYREIYGNEPWWPKDKTDSKNPKEK